MDEVQLFLGNIWFFLIGLILVLYVVLDGFDLGVGMLSLFSRDEESRATMMLSLGSVWDANETWLVVLGGALFGAFPLVYAVALHALYIPITLMIFGLIFRGVAFEFHEHARNKASWSVAFGAGSLFAAAMQGLALGGIISGVRVEDGVVAGSVWDWLNPFALLVAAGVVAGYCLLGATYLIMKTRHELQRRSYRLARIAACLMLAAAAGVTAWTPVQYTQVADKWFAIPNMFYIALLPLGASVAFAMLLRSLFRRGERAPFVWSLTIFLCSFVGLAVSLYPRLLPPTVSIADAAASSTTLIFMLTGIGMLLPVMMIYNGYQYLVFRGKVDDRGYQTHDE
jgi:cytochrome d ubiquinol oxidase subunit II